MAKKVLTNQKQTLPTQKQKLRPAALLPDQPAVTLRPDQAGEYSMTPRKSTTPSTSEEYFSQEPDRILGREEGKPAL